LVRLVLLALQDLLVVPKAPLDHRVFVENKVILEILDPQVVQGFKAMLELKVTEALKDLLDLLVYKD
jgi:transcriptional regulator of NAD metabolism